MSENKFQPSLPLMFSTSSIVLGSTPTPPCALFTCSTFYFTAIAIHVTLSYSLFTITSRLFTVYLTATVESTKTSLWLFWTFLGGILWDDIVCDSFRTLIQARCTEFILRTVRQPHMSDALNTEHLYGYYRGCCVILCG